MTDLPVHLLLAMHASSNGEFGMFSTNAYAYGKHDDVLAYWLVDREEEWSPCRYNARDGLELIEVCRAPDARTPVWRATLRFSTQGKAVDDASYEPHRPRSRVGVVHIVGAEETARTELLTQYDALARAHLARMTQLYRDVQQPMHPQVLQELAEAHVPVERRVSLTRVHPVMVTPESIARKRALYDELVTARAAAQVTFDILQERIRRVGGDI